MKELYARIVEEFVVVVLTILVHVYAIRNSFETFMIWDPPVHVLKVRLLLCDEACRCTDACAYVDYSDRRLHCELVRPYSLYFEKRIGFVGKDHSSRPVSDNPSKDESGQCSRCDTPLCPDLLTDGAELALNNFGPTTDNQAWTQIANFSWSPGQDGWNSSSCVAHSQCRCTAYDKRKTPQTAMRGKCRCDSECVDAESECRDGQCWCKPGLRHDSDSSSCVAQCPRDEYGSTFQEVRQCLSGYAGLTVSHHINIDDIHGCFEIVITLQRNGKVIKYGKYVKSHTYRWYSCQLIYELAYPEFGLTCFLFMKKI